MIIQPLLATAVTEQEVSRYGIIRPGEVTNRVYRVLDVVEKPLPKEAPSHWAIMGRYVLAPEIFGALENTAPGKLGEIQLTDGLRRLLQQQAIYAYEFEGKRYDAGTLLGWLETNIALALRNPDTGPVLRRHFGEMLGSGDGSTGGPCRFDNMIWTTAKHYHASGPMGVVAGGETVRGRPVFPIRLTTAI